MVVALLTGFNLVVAFAEVYPPAEVRVVPDSIVVYRARPLAVLEALGEVITVILAKIIAVSNEEEEGTSKEARERCGVVSVVIGMYGIAVVVSSVGLRPR